MSITRLRGIKGAGKLALFSIAHVFGFVRVTCCKQSTILMDGKQTTCETRSVCAVILVAPDFGLIEGIHLWANDIAEMEK
jgi:hypothetical protein